jgi:hypothetical protein
VARKLGIRRHMVAAGGPNCSGVPRSTPSTVVPTAGPCDASGMRATVPVSLVFVTLLPACGEPPPTPPSVVQCSDLDPDNPDLDKPIRPMTPSQDPGFESNFCQTSTCGNIAWPGNFKLPMPAATSGWIVQELSIELNITGGASFQAHYWEAFFVKQGAIDGVYPDPDDTYQSTGDSAHPPNSKGTAKWTGKAKFYEGTLPADFICPNEAAKPAGGLRATTTQPPFWDGTGTDHNLTVTWDCTGGNDIITVLAEPDPNGVCTQN